MRIVELCLLLTKVEHIRIITINTWKCDGDYAARLPLMAAQLKALQPAIVCCQECFQSEELQADTLKYLAAALQMDSLFLPGRYKTRFALGAWADSCSGLGILSRFPLQEAGAFQLPPVPMDDDRKVQLAAVTLASGEEILIANTHLTHVGAASGGRQRQAEALGELVAAKDGYAYRMICGDFNCGQNSAEIQAFKTKTHAADCYTAGNGAEPRYSLTEAYYNKKAVCVDHIFAMPVAGTDIYPQFTASAVVLNIADPVTGLYPSDHFGISTTLVID